MKMRRDVGIVSLEKEYEPLLKFFWRRIRSSVILTSSLQHLLADLSKAQH